MQLLIALIIVEVIAKLTGSMLIGLLVFGCMELLAYCYLENSK